VAVRYSGEATIRLRYEARTRSYVGIVSGPRIRFKGRVFLAPRGAPTSPGAFDDAAAKLVMLGEREVGPTLGAERERGRLVVDRVFRSPCPSSPVRRGYR
jgi:hypothetical protein